MSATPAAIAFDVYGTLVDPLEMGARLRPIAGEMADRIAELWRTKQLEYSFRRAAMGAYRNFDECTRQALDFALRSFGVEVDDHEHARLLSSYRSLSPYPEAAQALWRLKQAGHAVVAFSNGVEASLRELLAHAGLLEYLDGVVSVDNVRTFKPDPRVYQYLVQRMERAPGDIWLVSSNPFDIIGAKAQGLTAAWIKRNPRAIFDDWEFEPDLTARDLADLAARLSG